MARYAFRAAFNGATLDCDSHALVYWFSPLYAGWDGAARHPYQNGRIGSFALA